MDGQGNSMDSLGSGDNKKRSGNWRRPKRHYDQHRCLWSSDIFPKADEKIEAEAPPTQVGIKQEKDGSYTCKLCARRDLRSDEAVNSHCKSNRHLIAVRLMKKKQTAEKSGAAQPPSSSPPPGSDRLRIETDTYDDKKGEHIKVVTMGEVDQEVMTFTVTNVSANTVFRFNNWDLMTSSEEFSLVDPVSANTTMGPNVQQKLEMKMTPKRESVHAFKVVFRFEDVSRKKITMVSCSVKVSFVSKETKELASSGGRFDPRQKRPPKKAFYRRGNAIPGVPLPSLGDRDGLEKDRPLPWFDMTEHVYHFINDGVVFKREFSPSQSEELNTYKMALHEEEVTFHNYQKRFGFLLYLEEHQTDVDMESYFMERVRMRRHGGSNLLSLEVPGLAENRPSVLRGDQMFVKEYLGEQGYATKEYQGYVHDVQQTRVFLGFSQTLVNKFHDTMEFCVRFVLNRLPMRIQHRALTLIDADESNLENMLFPTDDTARTEGFLLPTETQFRFYARQPEPNPEQARAIRYIVLGSSRPAPYILFGPPGTGKTFTVVEAIKQVLKNLPNARILACAPSNSAADLIAEKLMDHLQKREVYRLNAFSRNVRTIPEKVKPISNLTRDGDVCFPEKKTLIEQGVKVYITTLVTAGRLVSAKFSEDYFTHVFVDEASHATEPEAVAAMAGLLFVKGNNSPAKQVVLAGDPKQLGPILRSPFAKKFKLDMSLMERLMEQPIYRRREEPGAQDGLHYDPLLITKLVRNYRSHPAILEVPNRLFYNGDLVSSGLPELTHRMCGWEELPNKEKPVVFHAVVGEDMQETNSPSFFNPFEVKQVMHYMTLLVNQRTPTGTRITEDHIGIISPYSKQVQKIRGELKKKGMEKVKVGSVEEFQGQERLIIIVSTVRSNPRFLNTDSKFAIGFLQNNKRFNVAVTRPKALLIVIGNPNVLRHNKSWSSFVEYCKVNNCMVNQHLDRTDEDETFCKLRDLLDELEQHQTSNEITPDDIALVSALNNEQVFQRDV